MITTNEGLIIYFDVILFWFIVDSKSRKIILVSLRYYKNLIHRKNLSEIYFDGYAIVWGPLPNPLQQYCGLCCKWWRHTFWNSSSCIKCNVATHTTYTHVVLFPARNLHNNIERCCFLKNETYNVKLWNLWYLLTKK